MTIERINELKETYIRHHAMQMYYVGIFNFNLRTTGKYDNEAYDIQLVHKKYSDEAEREFQDAIDIFQEETDDYNTIDVDALYREVHKEACRRAEAMRQVNGIFLQ